MPEVKSHEKLTGPLLKVQQAFGYTQEDFKFILEPMATLGEEATGSMGSDTPLPVFVGQSQTPVQLFQAVVLPR